MNTPFNFILAFIFLAIAAYCDARWQIIPNWLNGAAACVAVIIWGAHSQLLFVGKNLTLGLFLGIVFYVIGIIAAGDVKALAALSGFVGVDTALLSFIAGEIILLAWTVPQRIKELGFKGFLKNERQGFWLYISQFAVKKNLRVGDECLPHGVKKIPLAPFFLPGFIITTIIGVV